MMMTYDDSSSDEELLAQGGRILFGLDAPAIGTKFSSLNTSKDIREAAAFFKLRFRAYEAQKLSFDVSDQLKGYTDLVRNTVSMENEAARRMLIDPILMTVAKKVGIYLSVEQHLRGETQCVEGKLLCRGKKDYSFSRLDCGEVSREYVLKMLAKGSVPAIAHRIPLLITEAKFVDIVRHCNEQIIAQLLVSNCSFGILTNGLEWTFLHVVDGVLFAVLQVGIETELESVLAYIELFMKGEHLPPADGVWPRPGPTDPKEDEIAQVEPASDFPDNPSPSDHYLGFDASLASSSSTTPSSSSSAGPSSFVDSLSTPVSKPHAAPENDASRKFDKTEKATEILMEKPSAKTADAQKTTKTAPKPAPKKATKTVPKPAPKKATKKKAQAVEEKATKKKRKEASDDDYSADSDEPSTKPSAKPTSTARRSQRVVTKRSKAE